METPNPHLKAAVMEVVENQIRDNDPPETRQTLERLIVEGITDEDARLYIGQAVCVEIWDIMSNGRTGAKGRSYRGTPTQRNGNASVEQKPKVLQPCGVCGVPITRSEIVAPQTRCASAPGGGGAGRPR